MTFTTNLFKLFDHAEEIVIDGYTVDMVNDVGLGRVRCDLGGDEEWIFNDQEVTVHEEGSCHANALDENDEPYQVVIEFLVIRPIEEADLA